MGADLYIRSLSDPNRKIYHVGYFRDSHNDSNLFWKLGLDYWVWFAGYLDKDGYLWPDKAALVLSEVEGRKDMLDEIKDRDEAEYFHEKYDEFCGFLRTAIGRDDPIFCSI